MNNRPNRNTRLERMCEECGAKKVIGNESYQVNVKKNGKYLCHKCGVAKAMAAGLYDRSFEDRSRVSKALWQDKEFREKTTKASAAVVQSEEFRKEQSEHTSKLWEDPEYAKRVSDGVKEKYLNDPEYRRKSSEAALRRWQDEDYRKHVAEAMASQEVRDAISEGSKRAWRNPEFRQKMAIAAAKQMSQIPRSTQIALYKYLSDLGIEYIEEGPETLIGSWPSPFDCIVPRQLNMERNLIIECQGDFWHGDWNVEKLAVDRGKFTYIERYHQDYELIYIWEHEFMSKDRVLDRIKQKIGIEIQTIDFSFSDITIRQVDYPIAMEFLKHYHYLDKVRGGKCVAAYLNDGVISMSVFSKPVRQNITQTFDADKFLELSRFCIHPSYHKKNFASWFLERSLKYVDGLIVAYADTTVGHIGTIYRAANFKEHYRTQADYWYVDKDGFVIGKKRLYDKASKMSMTESKYADKYGYMKKFGGEKICFIRYC